MPKFYGCLSCVNCVEAIEYFKSVNFKYEFIDLNENIQNLKEFLRMRDNRLEFKEVKESGYVGIPAILMEDNSIVLGDDVFKLK